MDRHKGGLQPEPVTQVAPVLVGLVGRNIQQSRAPHLHQAEADAHGMRLIYRLFDMTTMGSDDEDLIRILEAAELLGFAGLNVTHPYKQQVLPLLSELSRDTILAGAANTVLFNSGRRIGHNTDIFGFEKAFLRNFDSVAVNSCVQVGAGGAGGATAIALLRLGIERLLIFDTDSTRARMLVDRLGAEFGFDRVAAIDDPVYAMRDTDGLINTTPVGMAEYPGSSVPLNSLRAAQWVVDIIYFPSETELLSHARSIGCRTMNGGDMAVHQAAKAFDLFSGKRADRERMLETFWEAYS